MTLGCVYKSEWTFFYQSEHDTEMNPTVLLIASYPYLSPNDPSLRRVENQIYLDYQLQTLSSLGFTPFVVLAQNGDELLTHSKRLSEDDLVFDPAEHPTFWTGVEAGLQACESRTYILDIACPVPSAEVWKSYDLFTKTQTWLMEEVVAAPLQPRPEGLVTFGFPWLLNLRAAQKLQEQIKSSGPDFDIGVALLKYVELTTKTTPLQTNPQMFQNVESPESFRQWIP